MSWFDPFTRYLIGARRKRIAVTGLRNTGKTVFITSLINHLMNHDAEDFDIDGKATSRIQWLDELPVEPDIEFHYDRHRRRMGTEKRWPKKTGSCRQYNCRMRPAHFWCREIQLELRDFPGERFADTPMYGVSFQKWSEFILKWFQVDDTYESLSEAYRDLLSKPGGNEQDILDEYKRTLAKLTAAYKPLISPSTFLLDLDGGIATQKPIGELVRERHVGVDADNEFAPLSSQAANDNPEITELFASRFRRYQEEIVNPLVRSLRACDQLVFLVDIPAILMGGPCMLYDSRDILGFLMMAVRDSGGPIINTFTDFISSPLPLSWRPGGIRQICFVAAKADKVPEDDQDKLELLLKQMLQGKLSRLYGKVKVFYAVCSAVVSAAPYEERDNWLCGRLVRKDGKMCKPTDPAVPFEIPKPMPAEWPDDWEAGEYVFPDVYPQFPKPDFKPPKQRGLNEVLRYLLKS